MSQVKAQGTGNFLSGLAAVIAQKFNLNQSDVQTVINQYGQTQKQNTLKNRLDRLVSSGKITPDQETAIINELNSLKAKYLTGDFNKDNYKKMADEFRAWLKSQNIDPSMIPFGFGMSRFHGRGMMGK